MPETDSDPLVVVVGSFNIDVVVTTNRLPEPGETVLGSSLTYSPGGKGLNQAVAAHRSGSDVAMIGCIGADSLGDQLTAILEKEGLRSHVAVSRETSTGTAIIEIDDTGTNRIVVVPGANEHVTAEFVEAELRSLAQEQAIGVVITQGEISIEATERAMRVGKELGARTILNPAPVREFPKVMYRDVDFLIPNEFEAREIVAGTGQPLKSMLDCVEAASSMIDLGTENVIVTRGEKGAVWANANGSGQTAAFRIVPVDTVAAGDAFCGVFATALNEGRSLAEALRWASAAGAITATSPGAVTSIPDRESIEKLLNG